MATGASKINVVTAAVNFDPAWLPKTAPDPRGDVATLQAQGAESQRLQDELIRTIECQSTQILKLVDRINTEFGSATRKSWSPGAPLNAPRYRWSWFGDFITTALALGAPEPTWDGTNRCFWEDRNWSLSGVKSVSDVGRIPVPKWDQQPTFHRMMESRRCWQDAFPDSPLRKLGGGMLSRPAGREPLPYLSYMSFIDMGPVLLGFTEFMTMLAEDTALAEALMDKCFELSTSCAEFVQSLDGSKPQALMGFGGDYACMLSPELYRQFSVTWDVRLYEHFQKRYATGVDIPCNLHSCGPSSHLYSEWGRHPLRDNLAVMQTRLLVDHVRALRKNLPATLLQLTFHPQHFDFATVDPAQVRAAIRRTADDVERRDAQIVVFAVAQEPKHIARLEENLRILYDELDTLNQ